jgi:RNA polymerase sigma factor (TIGR02999 family)
MFLSHLLTRRLFAKTLIKFFCYSFFLLTWICVGHMLVKIMNDSPKNTRQITQMLKEWSEGRQDVLDKLMPLVYDELRRQASRYLRKERSNHTLQTTALIHEAYLKLIDQKNVEWQNRAHFYAIAAQAMRRILVDYARERHREKRGGVAENLPIEEAAFVVSNEKSVDLVALDEALTRLAKFDARQARVVELRYFSGLSIDETAEVLGISNVTVRRDWNMAKAWLHGQLAK